MGKDAKLINRKRSQRAQRKEPEKVFEFLSYSALSASSAVTALKKQGAVARALLGTAGG